MTNLKKAGLAAVGAHALYKAHLSGQDTATKYEKGKLHPIVNYLLGAASSFPTYPYSRVNNLLVKNDPVTGKLLDYRNQSALYHKFHGSTTHHFLNYQTMKNALMDSLNKK
jgi:hypothetical protein